jgi:hypothetical protein
MKNTATNNVRNYILSGFGAIFSDVDSASTRILLFDENGKRLPGPNFVPIPATETNNLSFQGISYNAGERIARVVIIAGNAELRFQNVDSNNSVKDVVAMDDFIYGEPHAAEHHESDFDGDGAADLSVFRPSTGQWFVFNSGSNTFSIVQFGLNGDIPVDGDFDGDGKNDVTVFRPSSGTWFVLNSTNGQAQTVQFGANGDQPVAGDYDKDGRTDIAVWRPSDGNYYILRSSNGQAQITHWGSNSDIPVGAAIIP